MTREQAMAMSVGQKVMSKHSDPPYRPHRLTKLHQPETGTPMCQIAALKAGEWVHLMAFDPVPKGKVWSQLRSRWEDPPEDA